MSIQTIKIDKTEVSNIVKDFNNYALEMETYITDIKSNLDNISEAWKGVDAVKYIDKLSNDYINDLTKIKDSLISFSDYLNEVGPKYSLHDNDYSQRFSNIEV